MKKCLLKIEYCNSICPHFYHNYDDKENIYCDNLNKKIYDCEDDCIDVFYDFRKRDIPTDCPLEG